MQAKAKKGKDGRTRRNLPLPGAVAGFLNRDQVCEALGGLSTRKLSMMIAAGSFPRADVRLGSDGNSMARWSVGTVNRWCEETARRGTLEAS